MRKKGKRSKKGKKGFTLVELLAAITILGIIAALSIPLIRGIQESNEKRKFTTYSDSLEKSAKLYVDSYSEDLFGHKDGGCAYITWKQLYQKDLTKDIQMEDISCNSENSFVKVVKYKEHYNYYPSLGCGTKKNGEANPVTITLPDSNKAQEIEEGSCGGSTSSSMTIKATPNSYTANDRQKVGVKIQITSPTGINTTKTIYYAWSTTNTYNASLNWKPLDITIPNENTQESEIISGKTITATSKQLLTPANQTGDYYLIIKVDSLTDLFGTAWNTGDTEKKNYVIFGKYRIDNTNPVIQTLSASSSEAAFNSVTPKITLAATDVLASTSELKMCYSYDSDNCGKSKSDFKSSKYTGYTTSKTLSKIKNDIDGTSHRIYVTVVDPAGNYTTRNINYTISLKHNITYNFNGGTKGSNTPTIAYADREIMISNPSKAVTASFNANGKGATASSMNNITRYYTFSGWTGENLSSTALTGYSTANTPWNGSQTKNTKFKRLTDQYNATVKMTANWTSPSMTLPSITKTGHTCTWNSAAACNGTYSWASGGTYTPSSVTARTFYACCTPNKYKLTINNNGGWGCSNQTKSYGSTWGGCTPSRSGYTFTGWSYNFAGKTVTGNKSATANWKKSVPLNSCRIRGNTVFNVPYTYTCSSGHSHRTSYIHYCSDGSGRLYVNRNAYAITGGKYPKSSINEYAFICPRSPYGPAQGWTVISD